MNATMSLEKINHHPVMLDQVLSIISPQHGGVFIDCTFGGGGYSKAILKHPETKVLAIDRDKSVKKLSDILIKKFPKRFSFFQSKFSNLKNLIGAVSNPKAIIFDLGLSSFQLSDHERGFSFKSKKSLNMQMGFNEYSAHEVVNNLDKNDLSLIIKFLGDEKDAKLIANKIIKYRENKKINTAEELSFIIKDAKKNFKNFKKNPATKTFQALRIFVNKELTELISGLIAATEVLEEDGILIVVSFHSLEDKIVKNFFNLYSNLNKNPSRYLPIKKNNPNLFKKFSKKAQMPNDQEINQNIRSRSAKLRYAVKNSGTITNFDEIYKKFQNYFKIEEIKI